MNTNAVITLAENLAHNCGYAVFPCRANKKPACTHGFHDAVSDPVQVRPLWRRHPGPLIGGAWWFQNQHRLPETRTYRTRGGGLHTVFRHVPGVRNAQGEPVRGVDARGHGGYVIWWFADGHECLDHSAPAPWPAWLSQFFWPPPKPVPHRHTRGAPVTLSDIDLERIKTRAINRIRSAADGQRHNRLRAAARLLGGIQHRAGFSDTDAVDWLVNAVPGQNKNPEADTRTVRWGLENGRALPIEARP
jgi:hypothetical protein